MDETLEKSWKKTLLNSVIGAGAIASAIGTEMRPPIPAAHVQPKKEDAWSTTGLHPDLLPIAFLESSNGKHVQHQPHSGGPYYSATGALGLKPMSAHEHYLKNKDLQCNKNSMYM